MSPQEKFRVVKAVKIINGIPGAEFDPLDLLQINVIYLLDRWCYSAVTDPVKGFSQCLAELAVKQGRKGRIAYLVISLFCRIVNNLSAVYQHHKLIGIYVDHRPI